MSSSEQRLPSESVEDEGQVRVSLFERNGFSRRGFVKGAVAGGVALGAFAPSMAVAQVSGGLSPAVITLCKDSCGCATTTAATTYQANLPNNSDCLVWDKSNKAAGGVANVGQLIQKICDCFTAKGAQVTVFMVAHGAAGDISVGAGTGATVVTGTGSNSDTGINATNAAWFGDQIKDKATKITLFGCKVGADQAFLTAVSNGAGGNAALEVKGYDGVVCTNAGVNVFAPSTGATLQCS